MNKLKNFFNIKVMPVIAKMSTQRHLLAMRSGIVATIPFVIVGATALLLLNFPLSSDGSLYLKAKMSADVNNMLLFIFRYAMGTMGLFAAWGIGSELGKSYKFSQTTSGLLGVFGFLMFIAPTNGNMLSIGAIGGSSMFLAIVSSLASIEIYHFCRRFKITVRMPKSVPEAVSASFDILTPVAIISVLFGAIRFLFGFDLGTFMIDILNPLQSIVADNIGGVILVVIFVTMFWWVGIHGVNMVGGFIRPFWQIAIADNTDWFEGGSVGKVPYMFPEQFMQWFIWIGGAGATIGLIIAGLVFARSQQVKMVTKVSAGPAVFNINEPAIFGYPIMLNPYFLVPFMAAPIAMAISGWALMAMFDVNMVLNVAWTLPSPIGAYFSAGADWKAILISLVNIGISFGIWAPFLIMYDKKMLAEEKAAGGGVEVDAVEEKNVESTVVEETITKVEVA